MRPASVTAVVLAAGAGTRFSAGEAGAHKLLAVIDGRPVLARACEAALGAGAAEVVVVWGAVEVAGVVPDGVELLANPRWADGQASSLAVVVDLARARGRDAVVVGLGDQPFLTPTAWRAVASSPGRLAVATYGGRRGHPVLVGHELWPELPRHGDLGAREVLARHADEVAEIPCTGEMTDIDTVEDLIRWS